MPDYHSPSHRKMGSSLWEAYSTRTCVFKALSGAAEAAERSVWLGYLQWGCASGACMPRSHQLGGTRIQKQLQVRLRTCMCIHMLHICLYWCAVWLSVFDFHLKQLERGYRSRPSTPLVAVWLLCVLFLWQSLYIYNHVYTYAHTYTYIVFMCAYWGYMLALGIWRHSSIMSIWLLDSARPCPAQFLEMLLDLQKVFLKSSYSLKCQVLLQSIKYSWRFHHQIAALSIKSFFAKLHDIPRSSWGILMTTGVFKCLYTAICKMKRPWLTLNC